MDNAKSSFSTSTRFVLVGVLVAAAVVGAGWLLYERDFWPRGEALGDALATLANGKNPEQALVARVIWENYHEARSNAARWSGVYWGFTFTAAAFSALAALVLKLETFIKNEGAKKDIAALLSVAAALLVTVSSSGDFQRKWQANRIAAAELERIGYELLETNAVDPRSRLAAVGQILLNRHLAIVGTTDQRKPPAGLGNPPSQKDVPQGSVK